VLEGTSKPAAPPRRKLPEPLVGEAITDLDAREEGEFEVDLGVKAVSRRATGAVFFDSEIEGEWRATRLYGMALEVGFARISGGLLTDPPLVSVRMAHSFTFLQSYAYELFAQLQVGIRLYPWSEDIGLELGASALPLSLRLQVAHRRGAATLYASVGLSGGRAPVEIAVLANLSVFFEAGATVGGIRRRFELGVELDADRARAIPWAAIPQVAINVAPLRVPIRIGIGLPLFLGTASGELPFGVLLRLTIEAERD
jgi:hypothetical protein